MNPVSAGHGFKSDDLASMYSNLTSRLFAEMHDLEDRISNAETSVERDLETIELRGLMTGLRVINSAFGLGAA